MSTFRTFATVALAGMLAAPLSAQIVGSDSTSVRVHDRIEEARRRVESARSRAARDSVARRSGRASTKIPPGQLPPAGKCRVWIDGVPPGQQPPVTECATAEANRTANSRVIYGDRESFPGKGKGKFKNKDADRDDDRFDVNGRDDDDRVEKVKLSKSEKQARKEARKAGRGRGK